MFHCSFEQMDLLRETCGDCDFEDNISPQRQTDLSKFDVIIGHIEDILVGKYFNFLFRPNREETDLQQFSQMFSLVEAE